MVDTWKYFKKTQIDEPTKQVEERPSAPHVPKPKVTPKPSKPRPVQEPPTPVSVSEPVVETPKIDTPRGLKRYEDQPTVVTSQGMRGELGRDLTTSFGTFREQYQSIDPGSQYRMESGEIVSGDVLRQRMRTEATPYFAGTMSTILQSVTKPREKYVKTGTGYHPLSRQQQFIYEESKPETKEEILRSYSQPQHDIIIKEGMVPTQYSFTKAYHDLTEPQRIKYALKFTDYLTSPKKTIMVSGGDKPIYKTVPGGLEDIQTMYGGKEFLGLLGPTRKGQVIDLFIQEQGGIKDFSRKYSSEGLYQYIGKSGYIPETKQDVIGGWKREHAWDILTIPKEKRISKYYDVLPRDVRAGVPMGRGFIAFASASVTMAQLGIKYMTGTKKWTDPFGKISTGKTLVIPDYFAYVEKTIPGGPHGGISTVIGEGFGSVTGKSPGYWEQMKKYPVEAFFGTVGEFMGMYAGAKTIHVGKTATVRGLGYARTGVLKYTGYNLPGYTQFMKYRPVNLIRTGYYKTLEKFGKAREISPKEVFSPQSLPSDLSYAPGATSQTKIAAMIKQFEQTKAQVTTGGKLYAGIHTTTSPWFKPVAWLRKGRESPGVSIAPLGRGTPRFLRISGDVTSYQMGGLSIIPKIKLPTAPIVYFKELYTIPKSIINVSKKIIMKGKTYKDYFPSSKYIRQKGTGVYVAPKMYFGGGEYEVIARGFASRLGVRFFTRIEGITVPLPEFILGDLPKGISSSLTTTSQGIKNLFVSSSYVSKPTIPIISPSTISVGASGVLSSPSKISIPSIPSSSFIPSYKLSYPALKSYSYKPSSVISKISKSTVSKPSIPSPSSIPSKPLSSMVSKLSSVKSYSLPSLPSRISIPSGPSMPSIPNIPVMPPVDDYDYDFPGGKQRGEEGQGYNVLVKDRMYVKGKQKFSEKFIKINTTPLTRSNAHALMGTVLDRSAAQTGKIKLTSGKPKPLKINVDPWSFLSFKFDKRNSTFVEKRGFAIDTPGEVQDISARGYMREQKKMNRQQQTQPQQISNGFDVMVGSLRVAQTATIVGMFNRMIKGVF